ncbi:hypothetical protein [Leadbetterella sp. DM7]|uniref:hypothetical protein n=1 Tax=Leadbetterella sp. DM7 TaxID=3235085 RepID=UPI00349E68B6
MEVIENTGLERALERAEVVAERAKALLDEAGIAYKLDEWLTVKRYCERFNIKDTQLVTNWIRRGVIPPENVKEIKELNGLKLIKAAPYKNF